MTYLWFIWKARNDFRFRKRQWSILQVHLAVQAHIHSSTTTLLSEQSQSCTKPQSPKKVPKSFQKPSSCRSGGDIDGFRCYTDASIDPDVSIDNPKSAGLGIVIQDNKANATHYIWLRINDITSVIMAKAAALAFAAAIISEMGIEETYFHTDNEMLVRYFNGEDCFWMPSWDSRPFTQKFINHTKHKRIQVLKIPRNKNYKAHKLARSAFNNAEFSCNIVLSLPMKIT